MTNTTTELAKTRNRAAAERTTLAWIRTALALISFGFGLDQVISDATGLTVLQADDPLCCVANGTGKFLNLLGSLSREQVDRLVTQ